MRGRSAAPAESFPWDDAFRARVGGEGKVPGLSATEPGVMPSETGVEGSKEGIGAFLRGEIAGWVAGIRR